MAASKAKATSEKAEAPADVVESGSVAQAAAPPEPAKAEEPKALADALLVCRVWAHGSLIHHGRTFAPGEKLRASAKQVAELGGVLEVVDSPEA